jgi:transposase
MASTNSSPLTPLRLRVGTRTTPEKRQHGGARSNSGVKGQENISPSVSEIRSMAVKVHFENDRKEKDFLISQKQLSNPQGRSWPEEECKLLLMLILSCMHFYQMTQTDAINEVAKLVRRSYRLLLTMWRKWQDEEVVYVVDTSDRGGDSIHHINNTHRITTDMVTEITSCIYTMNTGGTGVTTTEIKSHLFNTLGVKIAARTLRDVLHKMGYKYGVSTVIGKMNDKWRRDRIRYFLLEYSRALRDQAAGTHVLVYTDETYVNTNHSRDRTWFNPDDDDQKYMVKPSGKGARLVILHAITKDGWLVHDTSVFKNRADEMSFSCELVYEAKNSDGDYHTNMNGEIFIAWVKNRLFPSFVKRYGRSKKMVLVLDNAAYHHWKGPDGFNVSQLTKAEIAHKLETLCGVTSITVRRQVKNTDTFVDKSFPSHTWYNNGSSLSPSKDELKDKLNECLKANPNLNPSMTRKAFNEEEYQLIYTPPYLPDVQPIERAWAYVKNYVASQFKNRRSIQELIVQTRQGFYGGAGEHKGLDATLAGSIIKHSHKFCDAWIKDDDSLTGDVMTVETVVPVPQPDCDVDTDAELDPFLHEDDDEE